MAIRVSFLVLVSWQCLTPNEYRHIDAQVKIPLVASGTSSEWEIDSRLLTLDHQLGHGQFGCVTLMTRRVMCQKSSHLTTTARGTTPPCGHNHHDLDVGRTLRAPWPSCGPSCGARKAFYLALSRNESLRIAALSSSEKRHPSATPPPSHAEAFTRAAPVSHPHLHLAAASARRDTFDDAPLTPSGRACRSAVVVVVRWSTAGTHHDRPPALASLLSTQARLRRHVAGHAGRAQGALRHDGRTEYRTLRARGRHDGAAAPPEHRPVPRLCDVPA